MLTHATASREILLRLVDVFPANHLDIRHTAHRERFLEGSLDLRSFLDEVRWNLVLEQALPGRRILQLLAPHVRDVDVPIKVITDHNGLDPMRRAPIEHPTADRFQVCLEGMLALAHGSQ